jgi:hypothetical protein
MVAARTTKEAPQCPSLPTPSSLCSLPPRSARTAPLDCPRISRAPPHKRLQRVYCGKASSRRSWPGATFQRGAAIKVINRLPC